MLFNVLNYYCISYPKEIKINISDSTNKDMNKTDLSINWKW